MVAELTDWGNHVVLENSEAARGRSSIKSRTGRAIFSVAGVASVAAIVVLAIGYWRLERLADIEHETAIRALAANADLQDELARLRDRLGSDGQTLNMVQGKLTALADEAKA